MRRSTFAFLALLGLLLLASLACDIGDFLGKNPPEDPYSCIDAGGEWRDDGFCYLEKDEGDSNTDPASSGEEVGENGQAPTDAVEADDETDEADNEDDAAPEEADENEQIPAGTYVGTIAYPDSWHQQLGGESTTNEVTIQVMGDGRIEGAFSIVFVSPQESYDYGDVTCSGYYETEMYGSFESHASGSDGIITVAQCWDTRNFYSCNDAVLVCLNESQYDFELKFSDDTIHGTPLLPDAAPDSLWTFSATKQ